MNLSERSDELDKQMAKHPVEESMQILVKDAKRRKRQLRLLTISVALDIILSLGLGFVTYKTNEIAQLAQSNKAAVIANCETANDSRAKQRVLWGYVLSLTPEQPRTAEGIKRVEEFKIFVNKTFEQRNCQAEANNKFTMKG